MKRFWDKVAIRDKDDCWYWTAATNGKPGYGAIGMNGRRGKPELAHRVSWKLENGNIPSGLYVLHKCDNKLCVNPRHLFLGAQSENLKDMRDKGRGHNKGANGERNHGAKLTEKDIHDIRSRYKPFIVTNRMLSEEYSVTVSCINSIVRRRAWTHV